MTRCLGLLMLMLLCTSGVLAQEVTGSISGTVTDNSGAVVPNATVTITNTDTTVVARTLKTDSSGNYTAPLLPLGNYSVAITAAGFKKIVRTGIVLNVGSKSTQSFSLEIGSTGESVTVQADANQVELQSAAAAGLIDGTQVRELALNGRNWAQLMTLQPGVSDAGNFDQLYVGAFAPQGTNLITFSLNGGRREENNYMVDGADNVDRGSNLTLLAFPSLDAISEFKIVRGQYDPELGRSASGQVNVITKSGTADLHGNIYEFFRNDALNANNYFNKLAEINGKKPNKPPYLRYHDFGGTIGGPVWIPKIYEQRNKTFFFFSEEARRNITYSNGNVDIPTAAMLQGNFLHPVCCAAGGGTTTSIAPGSFDPVAAAYIQDIFSKYPQPNNPAASPTNYISVLRGIFNYREEIYKIDHTFGPKFQVNAKMLRDSIPTREPGGLFTNLGIDNIGNTDTNSPAHNYTFRGTIVPSASLLIDVGYFYSYGAILSEPNNLLSVANSPDVAGALKLPFQTTLGRVPSLVINGGVGPATFGPYNDFNQNHQAFGNVSKIIGTHTIKVGATYYHYRKNENNANGNQGTFTFSNTGAPTGTPTFEQAWANFLQGKASRFQQNALDLTADIRDNSFEYYLQDSWRMKPNFTLTYGMRHSIFREPYDGKGMLANFDPRFYDPAKAPCILSNGATDVTKSPAGVLTSACNPNFNPLNGYIYVNPPAGGTKSPYGDKVSAENLMTFAPRLGFAWDPWKNGKTSIRGGFGLFFDSGMTFGNAENDIFTGIGFQNQLDFSNVTFANPLGTNQVPSTGIPGAATALQSRIDPSGVHPYTQQWSLDIQRDLHEGWLLDVGYYGNSSIHLPGFLDLNQPAKNAYLNCTAASPCYAGPNVPHTAAYAVDFHNYMKDPNAACNLSAVIGGKTVTGLCAGNFISNGFNGGLSNFNNLNALRPYIGYLGMQAVRNIYTANYNSLQAQLQKKFKNSSMLGVAYTWSHGLTTNQADRNAGGIMPLQGDFSGVYGPTIGDRRQVFTANFVWNLPWMQTQKGLVGHVLGGWELSGIQTAQTGLPATITSLQNFDPTGADCLGSSPCSFRVNQVGDPDNNPGRSYSNWINPNAYTQPAPVLTNVNGTMTWVAQSYWPTERPGSARLPGFWRTDVSLFKNLKFTERFGGQFRLEAFNVFNHTNPVCCSSFATSVSSFNKIVSTRDPRYLELALKLNF